jgi:hypothetical protein
MCLILSHSVASALDTIRFALSSLNVYKSLDVITALVTHTSGANEVAG